MKRLLTGLLLIGVVGCGSRLQKLGVEIERNEQGIQSSPLIFMKAHPGCLNDSIIGRVGFPTLPSFQGISLSPLWPVLLDSIYSFGSVISRPVTAG